MHQATERDVCFLSEKASQGAIDLIIRSGCTFFSDYDEAEFSVCTKYLKATKRNLVNLLDEKISMYSAKSKGVN